MSTVLFTGFPGFLGSALLPRVLARADDTAAVCLVQSKFAAQARERAAAIGREHPALGGRIRIVEGDITAAGLGLAPGESAALRREVTEIYHLAAVYDLSVGRELAMRVNVDGTRHVLDFATGCDALGRLHYVSTCFVSGDLPGRFMEAELAKGQRFRNFYEETKYLAEEQVRGRMTDGLPATTYRPSVVVGDSRTGATQKYDGPYFVIQWLLRQPRLAIMPVVGRTTESHFNVVPRDFVIDAIAHLSARPESLGTTYQLADPRPLTVEEMLRELARATERRLLRIPLPLSVARWAIDRVPGVYALMRIPASSVDYFVQPTLYDTSNATRDLAGTGIAVPPFPAYSRALVEFVRAHPEVGAAAMV